MADQGEGIHDESRNSGTRYRDRTDQRDTLPWLLTLFVGVATLYGVYHTWPALRDSGLAEIGEFVGGVGGVVAIIWLIAGYRQQAKELRRQHQEMVESSEAQKTQAHILQQQLRRSEEAANRQLEPAALFKQARIVTPGDKESQLEIFVTNKGAPVASVTAYMLAESDQKMIFFQEGQGRQGWDTDKDARIVISPFIKKTDGYPISFALKYFPLRGNGITTKYHLMSSKGPLIVVDD